MKPLQNVTDFSAREFIYLFIRWWTNIYWTPAICCHCVTDLWRYSWHKRTRFLPALMEQAFLTVQKKKKMFCYNWDLKNELEKERELYLFKTFLLGYFFLEWLTAMCIAAVFWKYWPVESNRSEFQLFSAVGCVTFDELLNFSED